MSTKEITSDIVRDWVKEFKGVVLTTKSLALMTDKIWKNIQDFILKNEDMCCSVRYPIFNAKNKDYSLNVTLQVNGSGDTEDFVIKCLGVGIIPVKRKI